MTHRNWWSWLLQQNTSSGMMRLGYGFIGAGMMVGCMKLYGVMMCKTGAGGSSENTASQVFFFG